jgi:hypothetical protein
MFQSGSCATTAFRLSRAAIDHIMKFAPDLKDSARDTRAFLRKAVRFLAERGIRQFVDIGTGLPTSGSVHEVAQEVDPEARVLYVDIDPIVVAHGRAMISDTRNTEIIIGDLLVPETIFAAPPNTPAHQHQRTRWDADVPRPALHACRPGS